MSQALPNIKPILVEDPRMELANQEIVPFGVQKSAAINSWTRIDSTTFSNSQITFSANPPSPSVAMNRNVLMDVTFNVVITTTNAQPAAPWFALNNGAIAPRYMPIGQVTNSITAQINGNALTQNNYQLINFMAHYGKDNYSYDTNCSLAPDMPDFYQNYNDPDVVPGLGVVVDPMQSVGQSVAQFTPRGSWVKTGFGTNNANTASFSFRSVESLQLSPFLTGTDREAAFIGVQNFQITLNILQNLARAISVVPSRFATPSVPANTTVTVSIAKASLYCNYLTPFQTEKIPKSVSYSYYQTQVYETSVTGLGAGGAINPGTSFLQQTQNIQLSNIPNRIYVFARRRDADASAFTSDVFGAIDNINVTWDNRAGILSSSNSEILYQIARRNGYNKSFQAWNSFTGAVVCLDVVSDIALNNPMETSSVATTKQLQIGCTIRNISSDPIIYSLYVVTVADGLFTISDNSSYQSSSVLSPQDVFDAKAMPLEIMPKIEAGDAYGGGFFDKLAKGVKTAVKLAKDTGAVSKLALLSGNPAAAALAASQGYGVQVGGGIMNKGKLRIKN